MQYNDHKEEEEEEAELNELDTSWLAEFETEHDTYKQYYSEDVTFITVSCIYVGDQNEVVKLKTLNVLLKAPNVFSKDELIAIIKQNADTYKLMSILKYNINVEPSELKTFLKAKNPTSFLQNVAFIDDIHFEKSISMFQDINELIFIFIPNKSNTNRQKITRKALKHYFKHNTRKRT